MTTNNAEEGSLITHLEALRGMLLHSIIAITIMTPLGFYLAPKFIGFLIQKSIPNTIQQLHYFSPMEVFILQLKIGVLIGFVVAFPFVINEIRKFVFPALYKHERKFIAQLTIFATILFLFGAILCIYTVLPLIMNFSASFGTDIIVPTLGLEKFINLSISLILAFGIMFQFPLLVILGVKFGLTDIETLRKIRPYVIVGILFLAAFLTPPDVVSQLILATPTYLLFEIGLLLAKHQ